MKESLDVKSNIERADVVNDTDKIRELDKFLVCGNMSRFDSLFKAMGIYTNYKEYTKNVMPEEDLLLNEIYENFVEC